MASLRYTTTSSPSALVPQRLLPPFSLARMRATLRKSYQPTNPTVQELSRLVTAAHTTERVAKAKGASYDGQAGLLALVKSKNDSNLMLRLHQLQYASSFPLTRKKLRSVTPFSSTYTKSVISAARSYFPFVSRAVKSGDVMSLKPGGQMVQMAQRVASIMPKSPAELVSALQAHKARLGVLRDQVERAKAGDSALASQLPQLEAAYKQALQEGAALVTASKLKQASTAGMIKRCRRVQVKNEADRQARLKLVGDSIKRLDGAAQALTTQASKASSAALRGQLVGKLQAAKSARATAVRRYKLLRQGEDLTPIKFVQTAEKLKPLNLSGLLQRQVGQKNIAAGSLPAVDPVMRRVMIRYLASRIPRRPGESRCDFVERLRMYAKRTLARHLTNEASGMDPAAAAESAVVDTITQDAAALEAAVNAGGQPADADMEMVAPLVDEMETDVELAATDLAPETAANSPASDYTSSTVGDEILSSAAEAADPTFVNAQLDASIAEIAASGNLDVSLSETTEDGELLLFQDAAEMTSEDADAGVESAGVWYKNPFVIGAAVLAAAFALGS